MVDFPGLRRTDRDEEGQGMVEYALIVALVAIVLILIVMVVGSQTQNLYSNVSTALP